MHVLDVKPWRTCIVTICSVLEPIACGATKWNIFSLNWINFRHNLTLLRLSFPIWIHGATMLHILHMPSIMQMSKNWRLIRALLVGILLWMGASLSHGWKFSNHVMSIWRLRILGIHCFGAESSEIVHIGQAIMKQPAPANDIRYFVKTTFNFPTMAEAYQLRAST